MTRSRTSRGRGRWTDLPEAWSAAYWSTPETSYSIALDDTSRVVREVPPRDVADGPQIVWLCGGRAAHGPYRAGTGTALMLEGSSVGDAAAYSDRWLDDYAIASTVHGSPPAPSLPAPAPAQRALRALPRTQEQLALVQSVFGLNRTQLAEVCRVQRQTVYDWYKERYQAPRKNAPRIAALYRLALSIRQGGTHHLPAGACERPLEQGGTLLRLLRAARLDDESITDAARALARTPRRQPTIAERRQALGLAPLSAAQRDENLRHAADD